MTTTTITGAKLDPQKVFEAHRVEMEFMTTLNVWDVVPVDECWAETGRAPIGTRWIDQNKGDDARPDYRSRLVVQETRTSGTIAAGDIAATFAATPPLEALRLLASQVMTGDPGSEIVLRFLDISRAHPHCPIHRKVYIRLPQEDPSSGDRAMCGRLNIALYGARDAGQNFEFKTTDVLEGGGCEQGQFSPCVWFHPLKRLGIYIHGDDYVIAGGRDQSAWLRGHVEQTFVVKDRGVLGPRPDLGDVQEIVVLSRILRFIPEGAPGGECIEYEADPRHADILAAQFGFTDTSKTVATPGVRTKMTESQLEPLKDKDAAFYRSACMRLGYLSMDRPELQYVAKECARGMAVPTEGHYEVLKRAARFVHGHRRMVWRFPRQPERSFLDGFSDSDWAGCLRTRKSTSTPDLHVQYDTGPDLPLERRGGVLQHREDGQPPDRPAAAPEGPGQAGHEGQAVDRRCGSKRDGLATRSRRSPSPRDPYSLGAEGDQGQEVHPAQGEGRGQHR